jgi:predicted acyl esterase
MTFDSLPLDADLSLLGVPEVIVDAQGEPGAQVIARLCEVAADGSSLLLSGAYRRSTAMDRCACA